MKRCPARLSRWYSNMARFIRTVTELEIWHADLYRLGDPDEVLELGLDEAFGTAICLVEWPDRLGPFAPKDAIELIFGFAADKAAGSDLREVAVRVPDKWRAAFAAACEEAGVESAWTR